MSLEHTQAPPADACPADDSSAIKHMHDVFSNWERRAILYCLDERGRAVSLGRLCEHVAAWRRGHESPTEIPPDADPEEETVTLRTHLRQLDEFGILSYDPGEDAARLCEDVQVAVNPPWTDRKDADRDGVGSDPNPLPVDQTDEATVPGSN